MFENTYNLNVYSLWTVVRFNYFLSSAITIFLKTLNIYLTASCVCMLELYDRIDASPIDLTMGLIGGKWKLLILFHLHYFTKKSYSELKASLPGISEKMLSQQLKELVRDQLVCKNQISAKPNRVEYILTEKGKSLGPLYEFISKWGIDYGGSII
jgi:DNA-binding HxlR family transcriptional regulator